MTRHGKARPGEARRGKTRRRPDKKVSPGFEKYCMLTESLIYNIQDQYNKTIWAQSCNSNHIINPSWCSWKNVQTRFLINWGQMTYICVGNLTITGSDNDLAPNHYLNQCWDFVNWNLRNKLQCNLNQNSYIFIPENAFETIMWKMC